MNECMHALLLQHSKSRITPVPSIQLRNILLHGPIKRSLFSASLESSVSEFRRRVDKLQAHIFQGRSFSMDQEGFTECQTAFTDTWTRTFDHDPVLGDLTVVWEATHWSDWLGGEVEFGGAAVG